MANLNVKRLERDIEKYIPMIIQRELEEDRLKMITITDCSLTHDLSFCKVFFTSFIENDHKKIEKEMNEVAPFIRGKLAKLVKMRIIPIIHFEYDESIEYGQKIDSLINKIHES